uniref:Uncharacterized protein n=1 Tax=Romanomermis culicivorax TaxID=13658 RepID=A0A915IAP8_ROMCU
MLTDIEWNDFLRELMKRKLFTVLFIIAIIPSSPFFRFIVRNFGPSRLSDDRFFVLTFQFLNVMFSVFDFVGVERQAESSPSSLSLSSSFAGAARTKSCRFCENSSSPPNTALSKAFNSSASFPKILGRSPKVDDCAACMIPNVLRAQEPVS